ncbi:hypothetical protein BDA96_03G008600 [Sorghum bicolor]|uniref:Uncharacterized protein n=2 Tax=Sorghum bicolor TaxID=4558 RepID=A0A921R9T8_SORBI|nr:hypothetical protein BDA96_03G008600 [Sorghum bicolor]KAG0535789.1 hypothetical protein BDA96_03G008600 [Sorghum bicolor]KAG0535791.1 hypothetical protein BDA96_03G008600 [Sorghum bicolor]KXG31494.1 hypothetical protein SORBI_3003G008000 [Sorghum bicolor]OQU86063.1 hypothetical protein SORBI_3003G008000 [Sorghum bicolor]
MGAALPGRGAGAGGLRRAVPVVVREPGGDRSSAAKEAELRATYCSFIRDVCIRLQLSSFSSASLTPRTSGRH